MSKNYVIMVALSKEQYLTMFSALCHYENILMTRLTNSKVWGDTEGETYDEIRLGNLLEARAKMSEAFAEAFGSNRLAKDE